MLKTPQEYIRYHDHYRFGHLPTEQPHPLSLNLSEQVKNDLPQAVETLKSIDQLAWQKFTHYFAEIERLSFSIHRVLKNQGRIFLCGCGATGRLSLSLEFLWRQRHRNDQVMSFMAGGDVALVHALEGFEDYPELGEKHLRQMGFKNGDLLIASTEGGETPFVIGATLAASQISEVKPWFLYCNPTDVLVSIARSKQVIESSRVEALCLEVGNMGLAGSTRMQASSVLMAAIGLALFTPKQHWSVEVSDLMKKLKNIETNHLARLIELESKTYLENNFTLYQADEFAITVFTDTTERSPTFTLPPFNHPQHAQPKPSLSYLNIPGVHTSLNAWRHLLGRDPRPLNWLGHHSKTSEEYLFGFDFSENAIALRESWISPRQQKIFSVKSDSQSLKLQFEDIELGWFRQSILMDHLFLKCLLNIHSTCVMGKLGRYQGNLMTYVTATNNKLIDRAIRYAQILLQQKGVNVEEVSLVYKLYEFIQHGQSYSEPIVLRLVDEFST